MTQLLITELRPNEVFVFGSNAQGFHGAGAAGLACRGDARNNWREDEWFLKAMRSPPGSPDRVGKWAVLGVAEGYQEGREGKSFSVVTIAYPGQPRSIGRWQIYLQLIELWRFAIDHPWLTFLVTRLGEGNAGYTREEMREVWDYLLQHHGRHDNIDLSRLKE